MIRDPAAPAGLRIGLLGGSFDPPHQGHRLISEIGLKRLGLDRVWWLVSPGNPLKSRGPADLARRVAACGALIEDHPRIVVTDLEARLGVRYTADTLSRLVRRYPGVHFVWMMGADNLAGFHRWEQWDKIMWTAPVCVFARPGQQVRAGLAPAARRFARYRLPPAQAMALPTRKPPCWTLLSHTMSPLSSTAIRARGEWP